MQEIIAGLAQYDTATVFNPTAVRALRGWVGTFQTGEIGPQCRHCRTS